MKWISITVGLLLAAMLIQYFYFKPMLGYGEKCPHFEIATKDDKIIQNSDFAGQYLIIDFWGSWCAPCRAENRVMVLFYEKYHEQVFKTAKGLSILSVALESEREQAISAIEKDGLVWPNHIIQTSKMLSSMAILFGIREIPQKFLISPDGKILLTNPDIKELDDYLAHNILKN